MGVLTLAAVWTLPNTLAPARRNPVPLIVAFSRYGLLLRNRRLLAFAGIGGFFFGGTFTKDQL